MHVYDLQLKETATWPGWGEGGVVDDGMLYASTYTGLRAASVSDGSPRVVREFDFPQTFDLVVVPAIERPASTPSPSLRPITVGRADAGSAGHARTESTSVGGAGVGSGAPAWLLFAGCTRARWGCVRAEAPEARGRLASEP